MKEKSLLDKKSIAIVKGSKANWKELAKDCVCFANSAGGKIIIGIKDTESEPPKGQKVSDDLIERIQKQIPALTHNVGVAPVKKTAENKAEYIELQVFRNAQSIASTSDGKYYMRVSDQCKPVMPDDLSRLLAEKNAFVWKEVTERT